MIYNDALWFYASLNLGCFCKAMHYNELLCEMTNVVNTHRI